MTVGEMQFGGMLTMSMLTISLVFLQPRRGEVGSIINRSRWLMAGSITLLSVHFLLQYKLQLRLMGVTQAVMCNLVFFIPCTWLISLSVLSLQRQGHIRLIEWIVGSLAWGLSVCLLAIAAAMGPSVLADTPQLRSAEIAASVIFALMQLFYNVVHLIELRRMHRALANYYDHEKGDLLKWMERSVFLLGLIALPSPFLIYAKGFILLLFGVIIFMGIYYMCFSFICYSVSNAPQQVEEAEENAEEAKMNEEANAPALAEEEKMRVERAVERWLKSRCHLKSGITMQTAVQDMGIPRYLLAAWLKTTEHELFSHWLTYLRIEEAKRLLCEHKDWSNDTIAQECGFSSRSYFQNVFRKQMGMTPAQWQASMA